MGRGGLKERVVQDAHGRKGGSRADISWGRTTCPLALRQLITASGFHEGDS